MSNVHLRPPGAKSLDPSPALDLADPVAVRAWITSVRAHVLDALAVAGDAVKPLRERMFSRHEAARRLAEEERVLLALLVLLEAAIALLGSEEPPRP